MGLHRPAAARRADWFSEGGQQGVAHLVVGICGGAGIDGGAGCVSTGVRARTGERHPGGAARGVRGAAGEDEKIHAERLNAGADDSGAGATEPFQGLNCRTG